MPDYKQAGRLLQFASVLGQNALLIQSLQGVEGLSRLFDFHAELLADAGADIDPSQILGTKVTIAIALLDVDGTRYVNGFVAEFEQTSGDDEFDVYRAHIVPALWQLTLSSNCRVFQNMTPMDIVKKVIEPYGPTVSDSTTGSYQPLDYCTQYAESDFMFISRIMEQFGIFYWFEHEDGDHTVYFGDDTSAYSPCPSVDSVKYGAQGRDREEMYRSLVNDIRVTAAMVTGKHSTRDYDYRPFDQNEGGPVDSTHQYGKNAFENYGFPVGEAGYVKLIDKQLTSPKHGQTMLAAQRDASDVSANIFRGTSSARSFIPGFTFSLTDHPRDAWNQSYLLIDVVHEVDQSPPYRGDIPNQAPYTNRFTAIEADRIFRPVAHTPKPKIYGPQAAKVVAPSGEDMYLDKLGRVSVQFFWDRERKPNTIDNTWVRVAQPWAGSGWGTYFWPRIDDEVLVQFLDGDPDNPVVMGSVYNGVNVPKYGLPDNSTRTGILTRSSKNGSAKNANELRFEDKAGSEEIYINAEKDWNVNVEHDHSEAVGHNEMIGVQGSRWLTVGGSQTTQIKKNITTVIGADSNHTVTGDHAQKHGGDVDVAIAGKLTEQVMGDHSVQYMGNHNEKVGQVYVVDSGQEVHIKGGMKVVIESGMAITLKGAGGFITIDPSGVSISGTMVLINSGGAAVSGTPVQVTSPEDPDDPVAAPGGSWRDKG